VFEEEFKAGKPEKKCEGIGNPGGGGGLGVGGAKTNWGLVILKEVKPGDKSGEAGELSRAGGEEAH